MRTRLSIRSKLLLVALLLLLIPWMSYVYVRDMKTFLLSRQQSALSLTSSAVSTVLHDRPELFNEPTPLETIEAQENDIYAVPLPNYINLDGELSDWGVQTSQAESFVPDLLGAEIQSENQFVVKHMLGYHRRFIYAMFAIEDDTVVYRQKGFLRVDAADHIRLTLQQPGQADIRYTMIARDDGRMSIYRMEDDWQYPVTGEPNYDLAAEMRRTTDGYNVELRIPRFMISSDTRIRLEVADVDDTDTFAIEALVATTPQSDSDDFSRLLVQSPEIAKILVGLDRANTRIWVIDRDRKVRAVVGDISGSDLQVAVPRANIDDNVFQKALSHVRYYYKRTLQFIFNRITDTAALQFSDHDETIEQRNDRILAEALNGTVSTDRRSSLDDNGTILMSAHPVFMGERVLGAVLVEQSTKPLLLQQQDVLENVISVTLLVLVTVATALLLFASRLTYRIRRLRDATDNAIDGDGRIINQRLRPDRKAGDEIGDLSRSVSNMLGRLSQYTNYLKGLPDTLAHEVSNPLNVVNSSLHNLSEENPDISSSKYLQRATNGINRIGAILRNLTEAANLEEAMQAEEKVNIDLVELIESYVDGYSFSNPQQAFQIDVQQRPLMVEAAPDYIAQLLDKLVDNAIDFAVADTAIVFRLSRKENNALIEVINFGSHIDEELTERIFEPLVSIGRKSAQKTRLGMGLYITKLIAAFHRGEVIAENLADNEGVSFQVILPIHSAYRYAA